MATKKKKEGISVLKILEWVVAVGAAAAMVLGVMKKKKKSKK